MKSELNEKKVYRIIFQEFGQYPIITSLANTARGIYFIQKKAGFPDLAGEKNSIFYMLGSMGLASSIGLGVSIGIAANQHFRKCVVIDGDGSLLMNLSSLATIGVIQPEKLIHVVVDNECYAVTGGQPTASSKVQLSEIAKDCKIKSFLITNENDLRENIKEVKNSDGPFLLQIKINRSNASREAILDDPAIIFNRFKNFLTSH